MINYRQVGGIVLMAFIILVVVLSVVALIVGFWLSS